MKKFRKSIALIIAFIMLLSVAVVAVSAAAPAKAKVSFNAANKERLERALKNNALQMKNAPGYADDDIVTAIVVLDGDALANVKASLAAAKKAELAAQRVAALKGISDKNVSFKLLYEYDTLLNGIAVNVRFGDLDALREIAGVKKVYVSNVYNVPEAEINSSTAAEMVGAAALFQKGYNGKGIKVAVLDTGTNITHEAFAFTDNLDGITQGEVEAIIDEGNVAPGVFVSDKIPFVYDYADFDTDVTENFSGHGSHVAGIVAGYVQDDLGAVTFTGAAPAAQIYGMKIFSGTAGTTSATYFKALEDAYLLDADVVNMSIGSPGGFAYDNELEDEVFGNIYETLDEAGVIVCCSAGNEYSQAYNSWNWASYLYGLTAVPTNYTDYGIVGNPSAYDWNLSVAAVENLGYPANVITVDGEAFAYTDSSDSGYLFLDTFGGQELDYVVVPGVGTADDYADIDVAGKVACVMRGETTFAEKLAEAANAGAIAMVCLNNQPGIISMAIDDFIVPAVSVTFEAGEAIKAAAVEGCGKLFVEEDQQVIGNDKAYQMAEFSSWGTTSMLSFKPMISGIGGNVYSSYIGADDAYVVMSGTSMSSPNVAGAFATLLSYIKDAYPEMNKLERARFAESLAESTAQLLFDEYDCFYSPRRQGSGLIDIDAASVTPAYIVDPLAAIGDSLDGVYEYSFTVKNLTENELAYYITPVVLYDYFEDFSADDPDLGAYNLLMSDFLIADEDFYYATSEEDDILVLPANGEKTVTISFALDAGLKEFFDYYFEYGTYFEGYVLLDDVNEVEVSLHSSFLGFYGDWAAAPIFDAYDSFAYAEAMAFLNEDLGGYTLADYGYTPYDLYEVCTGFNMIYLWCDSPLLAFASYYDNAIGYLGDNIMDYAPINPAHAAISNPADGDFNYYCGSFYIEPSLLRGVEHIIMVVSDAETGDVYYVDDTPYIPKTMYDDDYGMFLTYCSFAWDGADYSDAIPAYLANGTTANVEFYAFLDWEDADGDYQPEEAFDNWEDYYAALQNFAGEPDWAFFCDIDNEAPAIVDVAEVEDAFVLTLQDNKYISAVELYDADFEDVIFEVVSEDEEAAPYELVIPAEDLVPGVYYLDINDYATNFTTYTCIYDGAELIIFDAETGLSPDGSMWMDPYGNFIGEVSYDPNFDSIDFTVDSAYLDYTFEDVFLAGCEIDVPIAALIEMAGYVPGAGTDAIGQTVKGVAPAVDCSEISIWLGEAGYIEIVPEAVAALGEAGVKDIVISGSYSYAAGQFRIALEMGDVDFCSVDDSAYVEVVFDLSLFGFEDVTEDDIAITKVGIFGDEEPLEDYMILWDTLLVDYYDTEAGDVIVVEFSDELLDAYLNNLIAYAEECALYAEECADAAYEIYLAAADEAAAAAEAAGDSEVAQAAAEAAQDAAEAAQADAEAAQAAAEAAQAAAEAAKDGSVDAKTAAEAAKTAAEAAKAATEDAQAKAESAKVAAVAAQAAAEAAQAAAEAAQAAAEAAQAAAEAAQAEAANEKAAAEAAKAAAEAAQAAAETEKAAAEAAKAAAEAAKAEAQKAKADAQDAAAEAARLLEEMKNLKAAEEVDEPAEELGFFAKLIQAIVDFFSSLFKG